MPDKFHGEYNLQQHHADVVESTGDEAATTSTTSTGSVPSRLMVNRDTVGPADGGVFNGSRCIRQLVMVDANGPRGYEMLLAFERTATQLGRDDNVTTNVVTESGEDVATDKVPEAKPKKSGDDDPESQCFYMAWKSSAVVHLFPPKEHAFHGNCADDICDVWPMEKFTGEKHVYVKSDV